MISGIVIIPKPLYRYLRSFAGINSPQNRKTDTRLKARNT